MNNIRNHIKLKNILINLNYGGKWQNDKLNKSIDDLHENIDNLKQYLLIQNQKECEEQNQMENRNEETIQYNETKFNIQQSPIQQVLFKKSSFQDSLSKESSFQESYIDTTTIENFAEKSNNILLKDVEYGNNIYDFK